MNDKSRVVNSNPEIASNISYSPLTFLYYFTNLSIFGGKMYPPPFLENEQNSNPNSLCNVAEIQLWLIKTNCFTYLLLKIKPVILKTFVFKFENVAFNKLPKKLMIRHNKIYKMIEFFTYFHYFVLSWGTIFWHNITEKYFII